MPHFANSLIGFFLPSHRAPSLVQWVQAARTAHRSRVQLAALDADQLSDIGVSPTQAEAEANRSIWDVPSHWTQ